MSRRTRPVVAPAFRIGPWVPGAVLPASVGLVGAAASALVLRDALLAGGLVLALWSALRVRSAAPWLLVALLVVGRVLPDPARPDASLPALVLAVHVLAALVLISRSVPVRSRLQLAALGPAARTVGLVQLPTQALAALLLASEGRLQAVPVAATIGGALLVLVAGLLVLPRRAAQEE